MNTYKVKQNKKENFSNFIITLTIVITSIILLSCNNGKLNFDASGSFEAEEIIISSEAIGTIKQFNIEEGQTLEAGQTIGYIDSTQLYLKKVQLLAQIKAITSRKPDISTQLATLQSQLKNAEKEKIRIFNLVNGDAAPQKQLDDINAQIDVIKKQIEAQKSSLEISTESIDNEVLPLKAQVEQLNDQLSKCKLINPKSGVVLTKYAETFEMTSIGKPLYKISELSNITLRAYISGDQLPRVKLNQKVKVFTDDGEGNFKETEGIITWISNKAEFTPKTIQTKNERANMVYAIKVNVKNDGTYKIGMYGEIKFQ